MFFSSLGLLWLIVPALVALFGVVLSFRGLGHMAQGNPGGGTARTLAGVPLAIVGLALSLLGFNAQTFERLTHEGAVADVSVKAVDPAQSLYQVSVKRLDGPQLTQVCRLQGDEWEMSARVQKWKAWANVLGLDTTYQLDQVSNRYFNAGRANGKPITSCDLKGPPPAVNEYVPRSWLFWIVDHSYTEDRRFGSSSYMPLADGAVYRVVITQSGLNAEPSNDPARAANAARP